MTTSRTSLAQLGAGLVGQIRRTAANTMDRFHGIETVGNVGLDELGVDLRNRVHYAPSGWAALTPVAKVVPFTPEDTFVDFGSGKGRVVLMAARKYPLKRVIGVEISDDLNEIARRNVAHNLHRLACRSVDIVTSDALSFQIPADMTIAYFYSPFFGDVFRGVVDNIGASAAARASKRLSLVLLRPTVSPSLAEYVANDDYLASRPWLRQVAALKHTAFSGWTTITTIYRLA